MQVINNERKIIFYTHLPRTQDKTRFVNSHFNWIHHIIHYALHCMHCTFQLHSPTKLKCHSHLRDESESIHGILWFKMVFLDWFILNSLKCSDSIIVFPSKFLNLPKFSMMSCVMEESRQSGRRVSIKLVWSSNLQINIQTLAFCHSSCHSPASSSNNNEDEDKYNFLTLCLKRRLAIPYQEKAEGYC